MVPGAFVSVLFPTAEQPRVPGLLHIGYVIGTTARDAVVAYTTSQPWPVDIALPIGARVFSPVEAAALNQNRGFLLRMDLLARLPMTAVWFPDIAKPGQGVIAVAPAALQRELDGAGCRAVAPAAGGGGDAGDVKAAIMCEIVTEKDVV